MRIFAYGIRGNILKWFASYLTNRSRFIIYDNLQSETHSIKCGVPQGSILELLLFLSNVLELLYNIMYADGTSVLMSGNDLKSLIHAVIYELYLLNTCPKANKLSLNVNKT